MESRFEERIKAFLAVSNGFFYGNDRESYGDGSGDADGYGFDIAIGYGHGLASGKGGEYLAGSGEGSAVGEGDSAGEGDSLYLINIDQDINEFCGKKVWQIDKLPTIIDSVHGNFAKGSILRKDFSLTPCYVARVGNCFAHGDTLRKAFDDATSKAMEQMPLEERITKFKEEFPDTNKKIPARKLWTWHHTLTGSCEAGRNNFARENGINIDTDSFTVREFICLTLPAYGTAAIMDLAKAYGIDIDTIINSKRK